MSWGDYYETVKKLVEEENMCNTVESLRKEMLRYDQVFQYVFNLQDCTNSSEIKECLNSIPVNAQNKLMSKTIDELFYCFSQESKSVSIAVCIASIETLEYLFPISNKRFFNGQDLIHSVIYNNYEIVKFVYEKITKDSKNYFYHISILESIIIAEKNKNYNIFDLLFPDFKKSVTFLNNTAPYNISNYFNLCGKYTCIKLLNHFLENTSYNYKIYSNFSDESILFIIENYKKYIDSIDVFLLARVKRYDLVEKYFHELKNSKIHSIIFDKDTDFDLIKVIISKLSQQQVEEFIYEFLSSSPLEDTEVPLHCSANTLKLLLARRNSFRKQSF